MKCNSQYLGVIPVPPVAIQMLWEPLADEAGGFYFRLIVAALTSEILEPTGCRASKSCAIKAVALAPPESSSSQMVARL
jgi:hypothetical protein